MTKASKSPKRKKRDAPVPAPVGFKYPDAAEYKRALQVLTGEGNTMTDFLIAQIKVKASEYGKAPTKLIEAEIAKLPGIPARRQLHYMRACGKLDGLFEQTGRRILYDVEKTKQFFADANNHTPAKAQA